MVRIATSCSLMSSGRISSRHSSAAVGVELITPHVANRASLCTCPSFSISNLLHVAATQTNVPYSRDGRTTAIYNHNMVAGRRPHCFPATLLLCAIAIIPALALASQWGFHVSFSSRVTPRYLTDFTLGITFPSMTSVPRMYFLLSVN